MANKRKWGGVEAAGAPVHKEARHDEENESVELYMYGSNGRYVQAQHKLSFPPFYLTIWGDTEGVSVGATMIHTLYMFLCYPIIGCFCCAVNLGCYVLDLSRFTKIGPVTMCSGLLKPLDCPMLNPAERPNLARAGCKLTISITISASALTGILMAYFKLTGAHMTVTNMMRLLQIEPGQISYSNHPILPELTATFGQNEKLPTFVTPTIHTIHHISAVRPFQAITPGEGEAHPDGKHQQPDGGVRDSENLRRSPSGQRSEGIRVRAESYRMGQVLYPQPHNYHSFSLPDDRDHPDRQTTSGQGRLQSQRRENRVVKQSASEKNIGIPRIEDDARISVPTLGYGQETSEHSGNQQTTKQMSPSLPDTTKEHRNTSRLNNTTPRPHSYTQLPERINDDLRPLIPIIGLGHTTALSSLNTNPPYPFSHSKDDSKGKHRMGQHIRRIFANRGTRMPLSGMGKAPVSINATQIKESTLLSESG